MLAAWHTFEDGAPPSAQNAERGSRIIEYLNGRRWDADASSVRFCLLDLDTVAPADLRKLILSPEAELRMALGGRFDAISGSFLFLGKGGRHADSGAPASGLFEHDFLIRTFSRYGVAQVIPELAPDRLSPVDADRAWLERWITRKRGFGPLYERLRQLRSDAVALMHLAHQEFGTDRSPVESASQAIPKSLDEFLTVISALHHQTRSAPVVAERELAKVAPWLGGTEFGLAHELARSVRRLPPTDKEQISSLCTKIHCQAVLRDLGDWLSSGAFRWSREFPSSPMRILVLDDIFTSNARATVVEDFVERLVRMESAFESRAEPPCSLVEFYRVAADDVFAHVAEHLRYGVSLETLRIRPRALGTDSGRGRSKVLEFDIVLVEIEHRNHRAGPMIVEKLAQYFERHGGASERHPPALLVLSQSGNQVDVQQCLNLGAQAYVRKERLYELPAQAVAARIAHRRPEPRARKSTFNALYSLPPNGIVELQSRRSADMILGAQLMLQNLGSGPPISGDRDVVQGDRQVPDPVDYQWLMSLPKADLHSHLGTICPP